MTPAMLTEDEIVQIGARVLDPAAFDNATNFHVAVRDRNRAHVQMRAVLIAFRAAGLVLEQGWQPIETAPRDGTPVDLWAYCDAHNHWGRRPDCAWERMADWDGSEFEGWGGLQRGTWWSCNWISPTAWRPLPAAPPTDKGDT